ncbi:hypothetical protein EVAR_83666_1 [Eumeta japonica]|uniref:Uncharacterized protein n=1 Tax=Eumeta variegata TaxID=151549 RepID=A0A4C1UNM5_EUMVA|nr:hypothetical protein EVAR_83666_1 [Eumeta japonica]
MLTELRLSCKHRFNRRSEAFPLRSKDKATSERKHMTRNRHGHSDEVEVGTLRVPADEKSWQRTGHVLHASVFYSPHSAPLRAVHADRPRGTFTAQARGEEEGRVLKPAHYVIRRRYRAAEFLRCTVLDGRYEMHLDVCYSTPISILNFHDMRSDHVSDQVVSASSGMPSRRPARGRHLIDSGHTAQCTSINCVEAHRASGVRPARALMRRPLGPRDTSADAVGHAKPINVNGSSGGK